MAKFKGMVDDNGVIYICNKKLPEEYKPRLIEVLAELQDNECYVKLEFPKSRLHKVEGVKNVYRADIDKISGWRIHAKYGDDKRLHLCEMLESTEHDRGTKSKVIKRKKNKYD